MEAVLRRARERSSKNGAIGNSFATLDGARAFMTDPGLKEIMEKAGVDSAPYITVAEEAETASH